MSRVDAMQNGSYKEQLEVVRDELIDALAAATPGAKAQTAAQLRAVLRDLAGLPDPEKVTDADEFAARRAARLAAARESAVAGGAG